MKFGEKLQLLRKQRGMSQEQLALQIGVSRQAVSKWELGESTPDTDKIVLLSRIFDVTTDYLIFEGDTSTGKQKETINISRGKDTETLPNFILKLVKTKGYIGGYIIAGYAALALIVSRFAHFAFKKILMPPEGFGVEFSELPSQMKIPMYFTDLISVITIVFIILGIGIGIYLKKKSDKYS